MNIKLVRNWLNTHFIIGAAEGMFVFYKSNREMGTYIILISIMIKFCESALRIMQKE